MFDKVLSLRAEEIGLMMKWSDAEKRRAHRPDAVLRTSMEFPQDQYSGSHCTDFIFFRTGVPEFLVFEKILEMREIGKQKTASGTDTNQRVL